jgi:hypothetical protein
MSELIPPLKPATALSPPPIPPEVAPDRRFDQVLVVCGFRVAAREALPNLIGCAEPLLKPPILDAPELRIAVLLALAFGTDGTVGSPGKLYLVFFIVRLL